MKRTCAVFLIVYLSMTAVFAQAPSILAGISWLSSTWRLERNGRLVEEYWTTPAEGSMIGLSRTVVNGKMSEFEFLRIIERDGKLVYLAQPTGHAPTEFTSTLI